MNPDAACGLLFNNLIVNRSTSCGNPEIESTMNSDVNNTK